MPQEHRSYFQARGMSKDNSFIRVRGARVHNLADIDVDIPRNKLTVITGLSGSGKSSLAFDTIYADAQRRFVESISVYARQYLEQLGRPDVDSIEGLSPAIAIEQKIVSTSPRSTVGTLSEVYDYLRVLYARLGTPWCEECGKEIYNYTSSQISKELGSLEEGTKVQLLSPLVESQKGDHASLLEDLRKRGYVRVYIDGEVLSLDDEIKLDKSQLHSIDVVVDRLKITPDLGNRLSDSVELCLKLSKGFIKALIDVSGQWKEVTYSERFSCSICGLNLAEVSPQLFSFNDPIGACKACSGTGENCKVCGGSRLCKEALLFKIGGKNIFEVSSKTVGELLTFFEEIEFTGSNSKIAEPILFQIKNRLKFLSKTGLSYLCLSRSAASLSGGEAQRIRLASQIGSELTGVLYVLDEPSIGLHPRDTDLLLDTIESLRDAQNTVILVEHETEAMERADHIIDLGPGAGVEGGRCVASGSIEQIKSSKESQTGNYLSARLKTFYPESRRSPSKESLKIRSADINNLKNIDVEIPLGLVTCVTGVSGSGKSSLISDTLVPLAQEHFQGNKIEQIQGLDSLGAMVFVDQSPIGKTPRSSPATYTGLFAQIRDLFTKVPEARARGYGASRFSFNVKGGRCERCEGAGSIKVEMHFLPDVYVECPECRGSRYNKETLEILYKGLNISEVLDLTHEEAREFFVNMPRIHRKLKALCDVGLGYVKLGQSATTLSGGEAQRVKLATELAKKQREKILYIFDEPTTGLHPVDVDVLVRVFHELAHYGHSVIVVEHNLDVIKAADWIIDLGPEAGDDGGEIVFAGSPEKLINESRSHTAKYLRPLL